VALASTTPRRFIPAHPNISSITINQDEFGTGWTERGEGKVISFPSLFQIKRRLPGVVQEAFVDQQNWLWEFASAWRRSKSKAESWKPLCPAPASFRFKLGHPAELE
jgi:hypothetical protein